MLIFFVFGEHVCTFEYKINLYLALSPRVYQNMTLEKWREIQTRLNVSPRQRAKGSRISSFDGEPEANNRVSRAFDRLAVNYARSHLEPHFEH